MSYGSCFLLGLIAFAGIFFTPLKGQDREEVKIGGGDLTIIFDGKPSEDLRSLILGWVNRAARAVTVYYGRFPVKQVTIHLHLIDGSTVGAGRASGDNGPQINVGIGRDMTYDTLTQGGDDWLMTHEMVHQALPSVEPEHHWIEEGLATYVEPVARVRAGELKAAQVWSEMVEQMPQGEPKAGDQGLDRTPTWGRTYWGGAMFCLLADVKIRQATHNRAGLETALRGIIQAGGGLDQDWPLTRVLDTGDRAVGVAVLRPLYEAMKFDSKPVDLDSLWQQLGIKDNGKEVVFDNSAPLASIREAIMVP